MKTTIRPVTEADLPALKAIVDANGLFPSNLLDDMIAPYLRGATERERWLTTVEEDGRPVSVAYFAPERMTLGTWNVLLVAVEPRVQSRGLGAALLRHIENELAEQGHRVLLVETSGLPEFERTRAFYLRCGYDEEARIREYYQAGEDKVVFRKALGLAR